jgi:hypothetical protein
MYKPRETSSDWSRIGLQAGKGVGRYLMEVVHHTLSVSFSVSVTYLSAGQSHTAVVRPFLVLYWHTEFCWENSESSVANRRQEDTEQSTDTAQFPDILSIWEGGIYNLIMSRLVRYVDYMSLKLRQVSIIQNHLQEVYHIKGKLCNSDI